MGVVKMGVLYSMNEHLSSCPEKNSLHHLGYPSTSIIFAVFALTSFVFALIIAFKYNSVKVFNKKIRTQNISNTMWIIYYLTLGARAACNTIRYSLLPQHYDLLQYVLLSSSIILQGITAFSLSEALNHQRKYRSSAPSPPPSSTPTKSQERDPLISSRPPSGTPSPAIKTQERDHSRSEFDVVQWVRRVIFLEDFIFFVLFVIFLVFLYLALLKHGEELYVLLFLSAFLLQRIPIVTLVLAIVTHQNGTEGPSRQSKAFLLTGAILYLANDLPIFVWSQILPGGCPLHIASWVDGLSVLNLIAIVFYFFFLRSEYLRNMEECIWTTVSQIQDTFDFRKF